MLKDFSTFLCRRMNSWRKIVAVAVVLGLIILIWQGTHHFEAVNKPKGHLEKDRSLFGAQVDLDKAHHRSVHWTKLKLDGFDKRKLETAINASRSIKGGAIKGKEVNRHRKPNNTSQHTATVVKDVKHSNHLPADGSVYLSPDIIGKVQKFVFFIGYQRSGHSIIGSFMDAHPHMIIAHEFMLFSKWKEMEEAYEAKGTPNLLRKKTTLFNSLYKDSYADAQHGWRSGELKNKNYTLSIDAEWQGRFDRYISVIGDKSGGATTTVYTSSAQKFKRFLSQLKETVKIPIQVLHVVRNPFDMIATDALYSEGKRRKAKTGVRQALFVTNFKKNLTNLKAAGKKSEFEAARLNNQTLLESRTKSITRLANGNSEIVRLLGDENVLELHNCDLVSDPISVLMKICTFLDVSCSQHYLKACADKVFKTVSNTRELVYWPSSTREKVEELIKQHSFFHRYTFDHD